MRLPEGNGDGGGSVRFNRSFSDPGSPNPHGLGGVLQMCRRIFDGTTSPATPFGGLTLEDIR
jgi:hypothetical protein